MARLFVQMQRGTVEVYCTLYAYRFLLSLYCNTTFIFQAKFMPLSGDCHIVTCARDGQIRLAELSALGVCNATRKLARHNGAAHKVNKASNL